MCPSLLQVYILSGEDCLQEGLVESVECSPEEENQSIKMSKKHVRLLHIEQYLFSIASRLSFVFFSLNILLLRGV